jgi:hypothetical protein
MTIMAAATLGLRLRLGQKHLGFKKGQPSLPFFIMSIYL